MHEAIAIQIAGERIAALTREVDRDRARAEARAARSRRRARTSAGRRLALGQVARLIG